MRAALHAIRSSPTSMIHAAASRLKKKGLLVRDADCSLEDPFFALWIRQSVEEASIGPTPGNSASNDPTGRFSV